MPVMLPMLPVSTSQARPIDPVWTCRRSGDCCREPAHVVMTREEQAILQEQAERLLPIAQLVKLRWEIVSSRFVALAAAPCPFLSQQNQCLVYESRPYNCRRFMCGRVDVRAEPLDMVPLDPVLPYGLVGCANLRERLTTSRVMRRLYAKNQRHAQRWARQHGWSEHDADA